MEEHSLEDYIIGSCRDLNSLNDTRLLEVSELLQSNLSILTVSKLKEIKHNAENLNQNAKELFLKVATLFYAKFIQSIEIENAPDLILQYLKTIRIMKVIFSNQKNFGCVRFDPFVREIINRIKNLLLSPENIEDLFYGLKKSKEESIIDFALLEHFENEESLSKSYLFMSKIKALWNFDIFFPEALWLTKVLKKLKEENSAILDQTLKENSLKLIKSLKNKNISEIEKEIPEFYEHFGMDSSEIASMQPLLSQEIVPQRRSLNFTEEFSPIFENYIINDRSQFKLESRPIFKRQNSFISVWEGQCLLNSKFICVKKYKGNSQEIIDMYTNEAAINQKLSNRQTSIFLQHLGNFDDDDSHYIVMELCKEALNELIDRKVQFSKSDFAYCMHSLIKGLYELINEENIYHGDIKPENIMIGYDNKVKLIDFNVSGVFKNNSLNFEFSRQTRKGTPAYFSPEKLDPLNNQIDNELNDVYSLGHVFLEIHTLKVIAKNRLQDKDNFIAKTQKMLNKIKYPCFYKLINQMLAVDCTNRPRFEQLFNMIQQDGEIMSDINDHSSFSQKIFEAETPMSRTYTNYINLLADFKNCITDNNLENCKKILIRKICNSIKFSTSIDSVSDLLEDIEKLKCTFNVQIKDAHIYEAIREFIIEKRKNIDVWTLKKWQNQIDQILIDGSTFKSLINNFIAVRGYNWFLKHYSNLISDNSSNNLLNTSYSEPRIVYNWITSIDCKLNIMKKIENFESLIEKTDAYFNQSSSIYRVTKKNQLIDLTSNGDCFKRHNMNLYYLEVSKARVRETGDLVTFLETQWYHTF